MVAQAFEPAFSFYAQPGAPTTFSIGTDSAYGHGKGFGILWDALSFPGRAVDA